MSLKTNRNESSTSIGSLTLCESPLEDFRRGNDQTAPQWWEEEARHVIAETGSLDVIRLIYSYIPFQDQNTLRDTLSKRSASLLDDFLNILHDRNPSVLDLDSKDKAEEILSLLGPKPPSFVTWDWELTLPIVASVDDATRVVEVIDFNVCHMFCTIPFWAWVRAWFGHEEAFVTRFLEKISNISNELYRHLQELHQPKRVYELLEEELCSRHPLASWIVSNSLERLECPSRLVDPYEALGFLLHPIARLFKSQSLVRTVKRLEFLAVQFNDKVLVAERVNWKSPFAIDFSFLRTIKDVDPEKLAAKITESDCIMFSCLSPRDFDSPDRARLLHIGKQWNTTADNVKACVIADSNLVQPLCKLAVNLFGLWNYHSGTAVLTGLKNAKGYYSKLMILPNLIDKESTLSIFWNVIKTQNNYQCYRELWLSNPGLPFLFPHCVVLRHASNRGRVIGGLFAFTSTLRWENESRTSIADGLRNYLDEKQFMDRFHYYIDKKTRTDTQAESRIKESDVEATAQIPVESPSREDSTATVCEAKHSRSNHGCITCRRRKKKCDEAKPTCMNCKRMNVICEGYLKKRVWRDRARSQNDNLPSVTASQVVQHYLIEPPSSAVSILEPINLPSISTVIPGFKRTEPPILSSSGFNSYDSSANYSSSVIPNNPFLSFRSQNSFYTTNSALPSISTTSEWVPTVPTQEEHNMRRSKMKYPRRKVAEETKAITKEINANITGNVTLSSTRDFRIPATETSVGTTGVFEPETQHPKRRRVAVLRSASPLKQASGDSLILSKRIETDDTTWYFLSDKTVTPKDGLLNDAHCKNNLCRCKI